MSNKMSNKLNNKYLYFLSDVSGSDIKKDDTREIISSEVNSEGDMIYKFNFKFTNENGVELVGMIGGIDDGVVFEVRVRE
jgi:hypothetical protein